MLAVTSIVPIPGDILLHRNRGVVSDLIRLVDGSEYSHASLLHDADHVAEATAHGLRTDPLAAALALGDYADIYRLVTEPPSLAPVLARADALLAHGDRYAFEEIVLLAILCTTRRIPLPPESRALLRTLLDLASHRLVRLMAAGREPMICSEFVFRCFDVDGYRISVGTRDSGRAAMPRTATAGSGRVARGIDAESLVAVAAREDLLLLRTPRAAGGSATEATIAVDDAELELAGRAYLRAVERAPERPWLAPEDLVTDPAIGARLDRFVALIATEGTGPHTTTPTLLPRSSRYIDFARVIADFVTPADLAASPSLYRAGRV